MDSIIQTFRLLEHTQGPMSSDNRGTTVVNFTGRLLTDFVVLMKYTI